MVQVARRKKKTRNSKRCAAAPRAAYHVLVLATMSAGKSSLINALIGRELLPSANEATTACLTSVERRQRAKYFQGACFSHAGVKLGTQRDLSKEHVRAWNTDAQVKLIHITGRFSNTSRLPPGLVLHDTPGPNNSQNQRHAELMLEALRTVPFQLLCFVLNGSQLGTQDDYQLLKKLREVLQQHADHRILFILNKVDLLDPDQGEDIASCIGNARLYLEKLGFADPVIVPTMANIALYARKAMAAAPLTRVERNKLRTSLDDMSDGQQGPEDIARKLEQLVSHSGIKTVESLLHQHSIAI